MTDIITDKINDVNKDDSPKSDDPEYFNIFHGICDYEKSRGRPKKLDYTYKVIHKGEIHYCKTYKEISQLTGLGISTINYRINKLKKKDTDIYSI